MAKHTPPSVDKTSFSCPHCRTYTTQYWYSLLGKKSDKNVVPVIFSKNRFEELKVEAEETYKKQGDSKLKDLLPFLKRLSEGKPFFYKASTNYPDCNIENFFLSNCYNCDEPSFWIYNQLIWPSTHYEIIPNADLPNEIRLDFEEAGKILSLSPRGSAALLRLCIQKLCKHIGEKGKNINDDIANLVEKGLNPKIQKALDIVRVVGNDAVHPGQIDLKDDTSIAHKLFELVNMIAEEFISKPKLINEIYEGLPEEKRIAIEKRDQLK